MHTRKTTEFRPFLETAEPRIVATAGLVAAAHPLAHAPSHQPVEVSAQAHHAGPQVNHPITVAAESRHHAGPQVNHPITVAAESRHHAAVSNAHHANHHSESTTVSYAPWVSPTLSTLRGNPTTNQAWVALVNMTGRDLEYQIKLGPYADGQFLVSNIAGQGSNSVQYWYSSLITHGQRVQPDFAIQFGNGPVTPLLTGISQQSAQGYYLFMDSEGQYYVTPFFTTSSF